MKRRTFLKQLAAAGAMTTLPLGSLVNFTGCKSIVDAEDSDFDDSFDFDQINDRRGTWAIQMRRVENGGEGKVPMGIADMDFKTDPYVRRAIIERIEKDVMGYTYVPDEFAASVASWQKSRHGYDVQDSWVLPVPGVIAGINQAYLCFSNPGDKVLVQTPVYDPFFRFAERLGRVIVNNPMIADETGYHINFEELEYLCSTEHLKIMVLCNPHNPVGIVWSKEDLIKIADICDRNGVLVFSDEIHSDLVLEGEHTPFCSVSEAAARCGLIFSSPTKTFNLAGLAGMAYSIIPNEALFAQYKKFLDDCKQNEPSIISLVATIAGYNHPTTWLEALKDYLRANVEFTIKYFLENIPQIRPVAPKASFLMWLDCRGMNLPQEELMNFFSDKAGVFLNNGASYGQGGEGFVRMNLGCPHSKIEEALRRIKEAM